MSLAAPQAPAPIAIPGATLVELLVTVLIASIVTAAAFTLYKINVIYYLREDARQERDQELRTALLTVARDVRMAGAGFSLLGPQIRRVQVFVRSWEDSAGRPVKGSEWFANASGESGARAIFGVDGGEEGPDTLSLFRAEMESGSPLGRLDRAYPAASGPRELGLAANIPAGSLRNNDIIALVHGDQAALMEVEAAGRSPKEILPTLAALPVKPGGRFSPPAGDLKAFPAGTVVYNLRDVSFVTYYVEDDRLMADYHDGGSAGLGRAVIASGIEDFQVYYYFDEEAPDLGRTRDAPSLSSKALNDKRVRSVALGLIARSGRPDPAGFARRPRPPLFNRRGGKLADRFPRAVLTEIVHLRNF